MSGVRKIVITRPKSDAKKMARILDKQDISYLIEPMLKIKLLYENEKSLQNELELKPQAIIITSKYAALALAKMTEIRNIKIIAVGKAGAEYAKSLGFENIDFAGGTADLLVNYINYNYNNRNGHFIYVRGVDISQDIAKILEISEFKVNSCLIYKSAPARKFSDSLKTELTDNNVESVMFFSQNTAQAYEKLAVAADLAGSHNNTSALCISKNVAGKLVKLNWKDIEIAKEPSMEAMLASINNYTI